MSAAMELPDPGSCNCLAVRQAARQVTRFYDRHLAAVGLRGTQYSLLANLARTGGLPIQQLAARLAMDRTTLGRNLLPLEREGLVTVAPGRDARTRVIKLSANGRARLARAVKLWSRAQAEFEALLGTDEASRLRAACGHVTEIVGEDLDRAGESAEAVADTV